MRLNPEFRISAVLYWNCNGMAMSIVARLGEANDFACYIGSTPAIGYSEEQTHEWVARHGAKMDEHHARALFPQFKELAYRK